MEIETGIAIMENSTEIPQQIKNRATIWFNNPISGYKSKRNKSLSWRDIWTLMFTAAVSVIAKVRKQP